MFNNNFRAAIAALNHFLEVKKTMGADLYIKKLTDKAKKDYQHQWDEAVKLRNDYRTNADPRLEAAQAEVSRIYDLMYSVESGYYRDCYNSNSLLNTIGYSWWRDIGKMTDEDGNMSVENAKLFLEMVKGSTFDFKTLEQCKKIFSDVKTEEGYNLYKQSMVERRNELIQFLELAISLEEPIYCSL